MSNSFTRSISNAAKEFSRAPEVSFSEMVSKPGMFFEKFKGAVSFEQLQGFADAHCSWHLDEQMNMVDSNMEFVNFKSMSLSNFKEESFAIYPNSIKLHRVFGVFGFPYKVEGILSEGMFSTSQIHFLSPKLAGDKAHANFVFNSRGLGSNPNLFNNQKELNLMGTAIPLSASKAEVPLP